AGRGGGSVFRLAATTPGGTANQLVAGTARSFALVGTAAVGTLFAVTANDPPASHPAPAGARNLAPLPRGVPPAGRSRRNSVQRARAQRGATRKPGGAVGGSGKQSAHARNAARRIPTGQSENRDHNLRGRCLGAVDLARGPDGAPPAVMCRLPARQA